MCLKVLCLWSILWMISWEDLRIRLSCSRVIFAWQCTCWGVSSLVLLDWWDQLLYKNILLIISHLGVLGEYLLCHRGYLVHIKWIILILTNLFVQIIWHAIIKISLILCTVRHIILRYCCRITCDSLQGLVNGLCPWLAIVWSCTLRLKKLSVYHAFDGLWKTFQNRQFV